MNIIILLYCLCFLQLRYCNNVIDTYSIYTAALKRQRVMVHFQRCFSFIKKKLFFFSLSSNTLYLHDYVDFTRKMNSLIKEITCFVCRSQSKASYLSAYKREPREREKGLPNFEGSYKRTASPNSGRGDTATAVEPSQGKRLKSILCSYNKALYNKLDIYPEIPHDVREDGKLIGILI